MVCDKTRKLSVKMGEKKLGKIYGPFMENEVRRIRRNYEPR